MGYTIPGWLDQVLDYIGIDFPNVDEDDYRHVATAMREFADKFEGHGGDAHKAVGQILASSKGWAVHSMQAHWNQVKAGHLDKIPELARLFADACDVVADIIFGMKTKAEAELAVMAGTVGLSIGAAFITGGLSAVLGAAEITAMRQLVRRIIDEAADQIVNELIAKVTEPVNAKLEAMVEEAVLNLANDAFFLPPDPTGAGAGGNAGSGGGHGTGGGGAGHGHGHGGMQLASAGGGFGLDSAGGGGGADLFIDHEEFESGAGKVSFHGSELHLNSAAPLGRAKSFFGRTKGKDPFTRAFDSVLEGALHGSEKALGKIAKHVTETVPDRVRAASRLHKHNDLDIRSKVDGIALGRHGHGKDGGDHLSGSGSHLKIDTHDRPDPDRLQRAKEARALANKETCGDPIDMASGQMVLAQTDVDLPGILPLALCRTHLTGYTHGACFGPSWASTLDERLERDPGSDGVWWRREDGSSLYYPRTPDIVGDRVDPIAGERLSLTYVSLGARYVLVMQDPCTGLTRHFEPAEATDGIWWLARVEDRNHNHITLERDANDLLLEVTHSGGYRLTPTCAEGTGRVTAVHALTEDGPVRLRGYRYDESGDLAEVTNAVDATTCFTYDDEHRITGWRDSNDTVFAYTYDDRGRVTATQGSGGYLTSRIAYGDPDADGTTTATYTDSLGHATVYRANPRGQIVATTDPLGNTTTQTWDDRDRLLTRTDPLGHTVVHRYDDEGRLVAVVRPDGTETTAEYGGSPQPVSVRTPDGNVTWYTYDERGNRMSITTPAGHTTRFAYDEAGRSASVTDPLGNVTTILCNPAGLPQEITDPLGAVTCQTHDALGRPVTRTDPTGATTRLEWTPENRLARRTLPDGSRESWTYDGEGNCTTHIDPLGGETRFEYTHFDLLTARTTPDGVRHEFGHDTELRLTRVTNPQGLVWRYTRDPAGRLAMETDFDDRALSYRHDAAGRLVARTNALGETTVFERNTLGQIVRKDAGGRVTTYAYDVSGRLAEATGPDGTHLSITRDRYGLVRSETVGGRELTYRYDALGRRNGRTTPSGATSTWAYDATGRRIRLVASGRSVDISYDAAGRELTRHVGDFLTLHNTYDTLGRLATQSAVGRNDRTLQRRAYAYRGDGCLVVLDDRLNGPRRFDLDPVGRVTAVHAENWTETYAYDAAGNQRAASWPASYPGQEATGERVYTGTRITRAGNVRYGYDALGRITLRQKNRLSRKPETWRYVWDTEDRLVQVTTPDGTCWRYTYDPLGRRTAKFRLAADGDTIVERVDFTWDGTTLCEQTTRAPALPHPVTLTWDHQGLRPIAQTERITVADAPQQEIDSRFFAIVTDLVGSPRELVDEKGDIAWRTRTTLWGTTTWNKDATAYTPLRFPGQYSDPETGLHYNYFRHYDPETARYLSADPLGLAPAPNPTAYVHNPLTWMDPLGLTPCDEDAITVYRKQTDHPLSQRIHIGENGEVTITGNGKLYVNMSDDIRHTVEYRGDGGQIVSFEVSRDYRDSIRESALPQNKDDHPDGDAFTRQEWKELLKEYPEISDPTKGPDLYGIPRKLFPGLRQAIAENSGRIVQEG
ncbi:RHS repeat protein [Streptomyces actuosus]|uniref:RHS repeat protein n=1 Tax=Streptomyces actuosus TaxID=1885 RepID=A0ABS2VT78_STRAS|nr:RHS repeat-associated core domain-containing protein [Streptomyces actuosus]MBN0046307.1 RHS repeat protein [Streptomyces actuosus]